MGSAIMPAVMKSLNLKAKVLAATALVAGADDRRPVAERQVGVYIAGTEGLAGETWARPRSPVNPPLRLRQALFQPGLRPGNSVNLVLLTRLWFYSLSF